MIGAEVSSNGKVVETSNPMVIWSDRLGTKGRNQEKNARRNKNGEAIYEHTFWLRMKKSTTNPDKASEVTAPTTHGKTNSMSFMAYATVMMTRRMLKLPRTQRTSHLDCIHVKWCLSWAQLSIRD